MQLADAGGGHALRRGAPHRRRRQPDARVDLRRRDAGARRHAVAVRRSHRARRPPLRPRGRDCRRAATATPAARSRPWCSCRTASTRRAAARRTRGCRRCSRSRPAPPRRRPIARCWRSTSATRSLTDSVVELSATIGARGFRGEPVEVRVVENGRAVHVRRVSPPADGTRADRALPRLAEPRRPQRLRRRSRLGAGRADHRQQPPVGAGAAARTGPAGAARRGRARLRAQLHQARVAARSRPRGRRAGPQGPRRQGPRDLLRPGAARPRRPARQRLPVDARGAVPLRRDRARQRRRRPARRRPSSSWSATSSPSAAAAC